MVTQCLNAFLHCIEKIFKLSKAEYTTMLVAELFLIAKKKKKKQTNKRRRRRKRKRKRKKCYYSVIGKRMIYSYNIVKKKLKFHTSTWISLKKHKVD